MSEMHSDHEAQVLRVLSKFQMLELSLKFYVAAAYKKIRDALDGQLPFKYGYKDIENYPLERLLGLFSKLNDNDALQARMNKLVPKRNLVAHRALVYRHEAIADLLEIDTSALLEDLKSVETELNASRRTLAPSWLSCLNWAAMTHLLPNRSFDADTELVSLSLTLLPNRERMPNRVPKLGLAARGPSNLNR